MHLNRIRNVKKFKTKKLSPKGYSIHVETFQKYQSLVDIDDAKI
jgi:hypothetical protein